MENFCRLCLGTQQLLNIFSVGSLDGEILSEMILNITGVLIQNSDSITKSVCLRCYNLVIKVNRFRELAVLVNQLLHEKYELKVQAISFEEESVNDCPDLTISPLNDAEVIMAVKQEVLSEPPVLHEAVPPLRLSKICVSKATDICTFKIMKVESLAASQKKAFSKKSTATTLKSKHSSSKQFSSTLSKPAPASVKSKKKKRSISETSKDVIAEESHPSKKKKKVEDPVKKPFTCPLCQMVFDSDAFYIKHYTIHRHCKPCGLQFRTSRDMIAHYKRRCEYMTRTVVKLSRIDDDAKIRKKYSLPAPKAVAQKSVPRTSHSKQISEHPKDLKTSTESSRKKFMLTTSLKPASEHPNNPKPPTESSKKKFTSNTTWKSSRLTRSNPIPAEFTSADEGVLGADIIDQTSTAAVPEVSFQNSNCDMDITPVERSNNDLNVLNIELEPSGSVQQSDKQNSDPSHQNDELPIEANEPNIVSDEKESAHSDIIAVLNDEISALEKNVVPKREVDSDCDSNATDVLDALVDFSSNYDTSLLDDVSNNDEDLILIADSPIGGDMVTNSSSSLPTAPENVTQLVDNTFANTSKTVEQNTAPITSEDIIELDGDDEYTSLPPPSLIPKMNLYNTDIETKTDSTKQTPNSDESVHKDELLKLNDTNDNSSLQQHTKETFNEQLPEIKSDDELFIDEDCALNSTDVPAINNDSATIAGNSHQTDMEDKLSSSCSSSNTELNKIQGIGENLSSSVPIDDNEVNQYPSVATIHPQITLISDKYNTYMDLYTPDANMKEKDTLRFLFKDAGSLIPLRQFWNHGLRIKNLDEKLSSDIPINVIIDDSMKGNLIKSRRFVTGANSTQTKSNVAPTNANTLTQVKKTATPNVSSKCDKNVNKLSHPETSTSRSVPFNRLPQVQAIHLPKNQAPTHLFPLTPLGPKSRATPHLSVPNPVILNNYIKSAKLAWKLTAPKTNLPPKNVALLGISVLKTSPLQSNQNYNAKNKPQAETKTITKPTSATGNSVTPSPTPSPIILNGSTPLTEPDKEECGNSNLENTASPITNENCRELPRSLPMLPITKDDKNTTCNSAVDKDNEKTESNDTNKLRVKNIWEINNSRL